MTTPSGSTHLHRPYNRPDVRVQRWRHCLGPRKHRPRVVDDPGRRILLLRSPEKEERAFTHLSLGRDHWTGILPGG